MIDVEQSELSVASRRFAAPVAAPTVESRSSRQSSDMRVVHTAALALTFPCAMCSETLEADPER